MERERERERGEERRARKPTIEDSRKGESEGRGGIRRMDFPKRDREARSGILRGQSRTRTSVKRHDRERDRIWVRETRGGGLERDAVI